MKRVLHFDDSSADIRRIAEGGNLKKLIIKNVGLLDLQGEWNIVVTDGIIDAIDIADPFDWTQYPLIDYNVIDAKSKFAIAGLVDPHVHLDKCYLLDRCCAFKGDFTEAMSETLAAKKAFTFNDVRNRARRLIDNEISYGTTLMRTHVEVDPVVGFVALEAILELRKEYENSITIQIAVFAQEGITNQRGQVELMRKAMRMGSDAVSSAPYCDINPEENIRIVFSIAQEFECPVDFHLDYHLGDKASHLQFVISETIRNGWEGRVTLGHMTHLSTYTMEELIVVANQLKEAGISVLALPSSDLVMMGRDDNNGNRRRGVCPVHTLHNLGVSASFGSNNIQNLFNFSGNGDLLQIGTLLCQILQLTCEKDSLLCVDMMTRINAKILGINHSLKIGQNADFLIISGEESYSLTESEEVRRFQQSSSQPLFSTTTSSSPSSSLLCHPSLPSSLTTHNFSNPLYSSFSLSPAMKMLSSPPLERIVFKKGKIVSHTVTQRTFYN